jgi:hypothetical protein
MQRRQAATNLRRVTSLKSDDFIRITAEALELCIIFIYFNLSVCVLRYSAKKRFKIHYEAEDKQPI